MAYEQQYSYSGADVRSIVYYPGGVVRYSKENRGVLGSDRNSWLLKSLHTISLSVHEAKGQVRSVGFRGIRGTTSSVRTIGGSMIFLVINDHPLRDLIRNCHQSPMYNRMGWSIDREQVGVGSVFPNIQQLNRLATMIPPFNMINIYVNEFGRTAESTGITDETGFVGSLRKDFSRTSGLAELIEGIEFIDEGKVTSVNDIVTEITMSFVARNIKPITINGLYFDSDDARAEEAAEKVLRQTNDLVQIDPAYGRAVTFALEMETQVDVQNNPDFAPIDSQQTTPPATNSVYDKYSVTIDNIGTETDIQLDMGRIVFDKVPY